MPTFSHQAVLFHVAALIINTHSFLVKGSPMRHGICSSPWLHRQFPKVTLSTSRLHVLNRAGDGYYQDKVPRRAEFDLFEDDSMRTELSAIRKERIERKKEFQATFERIEKKNDFQAISVHYGNDLWNLRAKLITMSKKPMERLSAGEDTKNTRKKLRGLKAQVANTVSGLELDKVYVAIDEYRFDDAEKHFARAADARSHVAQFKLEGLWVRKNGDHGFEMVNVTNIGDTLICRKVAGDKNVPVGETTFQVDLSPPRQPKSLSESNQELIVWSTVALDDAPALLSSAGPETSLKARGGGYLANQSKLSLSYYADIAWSVIILIFMVFWFRSKTQFEAGNYVHAFPNFNTMVLKDGFCINPTPKGPLGTLKLCGIADAILTSGSYFKFRDKLNIGRNKIFFYASAGYTLLHGAIHFFEVDQTGQIFSSDNSMGQNVLGVALLAVITAFTPIGINGTFNQVGKKGGLVVGVAAWVAFVLFYMFGIKEKVYALTYINVTIFLSIFGSRALLFKKKDPRRLEFYMGPSVLKTIIATTANIMVMCFEHLACKDWFASVGGHVWFDVTLWVMLMSAMAV